MQVGQHDAACFAGPRPHEYVAGVQVAMVEPERVHAADQHRQALVEQRAFPRRLRPERRVRIVHALEEARGIERRAQQPPLALRPHGKGLGYRHTGRVQIARGFPLRPRSPAPNEREKALPVGTRRVDLEQHGPHAVPHDATRLPRHGGAQHAALARPRHGIRQQLDVDGALGPS